MKKNHKSAKRITSQDLIDTVNEQNEAEQVKAQKILEEEYNKFKEEKIRVKAMGGKELAEWLIDKHDDFVETVNYQISQDFLNGDTAMDRYLIVMYIAELSNLLTAYEIEPFDKDFINVLVEKNYAELLSILNVLNYI